MNIPIQIKCINMEKIPQLFFKVNKLVYSPIIWIDIAEDFQLIYNIAMNEKKNLITIIIIIVAFLGIAILGSFLMDLAGKIPDNDPALSGTTAGNQYHGGLFCEKDGIIYFSNLYDSGSLYSMQPGQSNLTKLAGGEIYYINAGGDYIYYYSQSSGGEAGLGYLLGSRGIYRCSRKGQNVTSIAKVTSDGLLLLGNFLYYTEFAEGNGNSGNALVTLHTVTTNGENDTMIADGHPQLGTIYNGLLYYSSMESNYTLCSYDPSSQFLGVALEQSMYQPIIQNGIVYYMDVHDNYSLKAYALYDGSVQTIVSERVDSFNVLDNIIYYQNCDPDNYALKRIHTDGTGEEIVRTGVFHNINMTSEYVYFTSFQNDLPIYQTPTFGAVEVTTFDAALEAASSQMKN